MKTYTKEDMQTAFVDGAVYIYLGGMATGAYEESVRRYDPELRTAKWETEHPSGSIRFNPQREEYEVSSTTGKWSSVFSFYVGDLTPEQLRIMADLKESPYDTV